MKRLALCIIIALVCATGCTGCSNPVAVYVWGPNLPSGQGDVWFQNGEGFDLMVVGDPGDNDPWLRRWKSRIYPGMWGYVTTDTGPHRFWVLRQFPSQDFQVIYQIDVTVTQGGCYAMVIFTDGKVDVPCATTPRDDR